MGFLSWAKGVMNKLIGKSTIEQALRIHTATSSAMDDAISLWAKMYQDNPPWKSKTVQTLNFPAVIAAKVAKLVTVEAKMSLQGSPRADWLSNCLSPVWGDIRNLTEISAAKGAMVFKPYISGGQIYIDTIHADRFFPLSHDSNHEITSGIFVTSKTEDATVYTRLETHEFKNGGYRVTQSAYRSNIAGVLGTPCPLSCVSEWAELSPETTLQYLSRPLFVYWRMPFANSIDDTSPLGVSIYSRAADTIEQLDRQYSRLLWEFEAGEAAIHVSQDMLQPKPGSKFGEVLLPKGKERLYRILGDGISDDKNYFQHYAPALRDTSLVNGFNLLLRQIEQQCGLAHGTFSDPEAVAKTATEIVSAKQESYTTVADIQKSLEKALSALLVSVDELTTAAKLAPQGSWEVAFDWDDSIITDQNERKKQFWQYVQAGKFPFWRYLVEFEGFTENDARAVQAESSQAMGDPYA